MTDGVLETSTTLTFNKCEKESGQSPSKLRMTADTIASFKENIDKGKMPAVTEKFNKEYHEIRQALIAAENAAAEQQVMSTVMNGGKSQEEIEKEKAKQFALLKEEQQLAQMASVQIVKPKLDKLVLEPTTPEMIFGKNEKGLVAKINAPTLVPKALMVPIYFGKIYKKIGKNSSLYKLADSIIGTQEMQMIVNPEDPTMINNLAVTTPPKVANWRGLFDNSPFKYTANENQYESKKNQKSDEITPVSVEQKGLTKEELADRKMKAQIGDELSEIRRLRKGLAGTTPFNDGLIERENTLLKMLSEISGIQIKQKDISIDLEQNVTEFQKFIDEIIGYKKPLTSEEYDEKEREMEEHYSDPEVVETMRALQLKNILYDLNMPESYERITEAERKDNELKAAKSSALELLDQTEKTLEVNIANEETNSLINMKTAAEEQAKMLQVYNKNADLVNGAEEQANILYALNQQADLVNGAEEQAKILHTYNQQADLINGAEEQAKMLQVFNKNADLVNGAEEQAKILFERQMEEVARENNFWKNGAEEQANMLYALNQQADLVNGAEDQAKLLFAQLIEEENKIAQEKAFWKAGAEEQAKMIFNMNQKMDLVNSAVEQAKLLFAQEKEEINQKESENKSLKLGAEEQAKMIHLHNQRADLVNGAEEQAKIIHLHNQRVDLVNSAEEQAKILFENNRKQELIEKQEQLKKQQEEQLRVQREQQRALDIQKELAQLRLAAVEQAKRIQANNERVDLINAAEEQAKVLFEQAKKEQEQTTQPIITPQTPVVETPKIQILNLELTDVDYRYGSIVSPSKPIKVNQIQIGKMRKANPKQKNQNVTDMKDMLVSLKEQLEELGLGTEQEKTYNDSFSLAA